MTDVKGSNKRPRSTDREEEDSSPTARLQHPSVKKEQNTEMNTRSPRKRRRSRSSKDQTSDPKKELKDKSSIKAKDSKRQTPFGKPKSSPLTTPRAGTRGIHVDVSKTQHASRPNPLVDMIYAVTQYFTESKADTVPCPRREDTLPKFMDCVNSLVLSSTGLSHPLPTLLAGNSFSGLTQEEIVSMWSCNNLVAKGSINFGSSQELLGDTLKLPASFIQQLDTVYTVNVDAVVSLPLRANG